MNLERTMLRGGISGVLSRLLKFIYRGLYLWSILGAFHILISVHTYNSYVWNNVIIPQLWLNVKLGALLGLVIFLIFVLVDFIIRSRTFATIGPAIAGGLCGWLASNSNIFISFSQYVRSSGFRELTGIVLGLVTGVGICIIHAVKLLEKK